VLADEAVAAEDLHALVGDPHRVLRGVEARVVGGARRAQALLEVARRLPDQPALRLRVERLCVDEEAAAARDALEHDVLAAGEATDEVALLMDDRDAGKFNTPSFLWAQWMEDYGVEAALQIAAANFDEAPLDITVKSNPRHWAEKLEASLLPTGTLRKTGGGFIPDLPGFTEGEWWVQNAAAALPAWLFGDLKNKTVIDLCAAPGGKTAQLAAASTRR